MWKCAIKYFAGRIGVFSGKLLEQLWKQVENWTRLPLSQAKLTLNLLAGGLLRITCRRGMPGFLEVLRGLASNWSFWFGLVRVGFLVPQFCVQAQTFAPLPCTQLLCVSKGLQLFIKKESRSGSWHWKKTPNVWLSIVNEGSMHVFGCVGKEESCGCLQCRCDVWRGS